MFMMVSMAMSMKARNAKALKPVWGGHSALADLPSQGKLLVAVLEKSSDAKEELDARSKDSNWRSVGLIEVQAMVVLWDQHRFRLCQLLTVRYKEKLTVI